MWVKCVDKKCQEWWGIRNGFFLLNGGCYICKKMKQQFHLYIYLMQLNVTPTLKAIKSFQNKLNIKELCELNHHNRVS